MKIAKIIRRGDQWLVTTEDGSKVLGTHSSHTSAVRQLQAIEINKHKEGATNRPCMGGCDEPSTRDNPVQEYRLENGTVITRHRQCQINETRGASRKIAALVCPECGAVSDTGDDDETDPLQVMGDICLECGHGKLKPTVLGSLKSAFEGKINPAAIGNDGTHTTNKQNPVDHLTPQAPMTKTQVGGLDGNGDKQESTIETTGQ